jgi:Mg-chelatase subunit ChlD
MTTTHADTPNATAPGADTTRADIWFLLDRSGSMASIADDVVGGFNAFFTDQQAQAGEATVSIVQFDSQDPQEFLVNRRPLSDVSTLRPGDFVPRGGTPLLDALGALLDHAEAVAEHGEDQLIVVLTDGQENASVRWSRDDLFGRIAKLTDRGWTFVFLGANQDAYSEAGRLGMAAGNISSFDASPEGVKRTFAGTSRAVTEWRTRARAERRAHRDQFWGDRKEGEES